MGRAFSTKNTGAYPVLLPKDAPRATDDAFSVSNEAPQVRHLNRPNSGLAVQEKYVRVVQRKRQHIEPEPAHPVLDSRDCVGMLRIKKLVELHGDLHH